MLDFCRLIDGNRKYYIYGINNTAKFAFDKITEKFGEDVVAGFIETVPTEDTYCEKSVYNVEQAARRAAPSDRFILTSRNNSDDMRKNLTACGITADAFVDMSEYRFLSNPMAGKQIQDILLWPPLDERNPDLTDKIKWFMPDRIRIRIYSTKEAVIKDFSDAENVEFADWENRKEIFDEVDYIYVWDANGIDETLSDYTDKIMVIDPEFCYHRDIALYGNIYFNSFSKAEKETFTEHSKEVMKKMREEYGGRRRANVFCTGPSIEEIFECDFSNDVNIICNSMIKDRELMERLQPGILTFGDVAFYLSPNQYCQAFYRDLLYAFEKYRFYVIVYEYQVPLVKNHFPMLYDHLIGIRFDNKVRWHFPDSTDLYVKTTRNICTLFMLPVASAICDEIGIAGCTGRNPDETYFWKHNDNTQYLDLMHYVFEAYPAFFKYSNYGDYYDRHCQSMRELIEYGEMLDKKYINLTTSFIPVLKERAVSEGGVKRQEKSGTMPRVSVIVPVYNSEQYLCGCLDSVTDQTLKNIEIICIDDSSTDSSGNILKRYAESDNRIKILINDRNMGQAFSRNRALEMAAGEYIQFLDSDDYLSGSDALESLYYIAVKNDLDLLKSSWMIREEDIEKTGVRYPDTVAETVCSGRELLYRLECHNVCSRITFSNFVKRKFLRKNKIRFYNGIIHEDILYSYDLYYYAEKAMCVNQYTYMYVKHEGSTIMRPKDFRHLNGHLVCINEILKKNIINSLPELRYATMKYIVRIYFEILKIKAEMGDTVRSEAFDEELEKLYQIFWNGSGGNQDHGNNTGYIKTENFISDLATVIKNKKVYVYGAGKAARELLEILTKQDIPIDGVFVTNMKNSKKTLFGHKVKGIDVYEHTDERAVFLVAITEKYVGDTIHMLHSKGIENVIYVC